MKKYTLRFRVVDWKNFDEIKRGLKTIETRAASIRYRNIQKGDGLVFVCGKERIAKKIKRVRHFTSVTALFKAIPFKKIMPSARTLTDARNTYDGYPGYKEKIREFGILALYL